MRKIGSDAPPETSKESSLCNSSASLLAARPPQRPHPTSRAFYDAQFHAEAYGRGPAGPAPDGLGRFVRDHQLADKQVLEIGCGRGAFQGLVKRWVGLDVTPAAGRLISSAFVCGMAEALPFRGERFDAAWSISVLEHVADPEAALEELTRVLKPGGVAYLAPAWHCRPWAAQGLQVRPWSALDWRRRLVKAAIPLRNALWFRASYLLPTRIFREIYFLLTGRKPQRFRYWKLEPNYETYWCSDSDACSAMDPHEMLLWFRSRGWETPSHKGWLDRLLVRHGALTVRKPTAQESLVSGHERRAHRNRSDPEYLNLGCGRRVTTGWLNVDGSPSAWLARHPWLRSSLVLLGVIPRRSEYLTWPADILFHDVRRPLPFRSASFRGIYTSNMIHYLAPHELEKMLRECHRVLEPGGVFRSRQIDLRKAAKAYLACADDPFAVYDMAAVYELQREWRPRGPLLFQLGAELFSKLRVKCTYDVASLSHLLRVVGFVGIREARYLDSRLTNVANLEFEANFVMGFCLEAYKPGENTDAV